MDRDDEQILSLDEDIDERQVQPFAASIYDVSNQENDSNSIGIGGGNFDSEQAGNGINIEYELRLLQAQVFIEDAAMYRAVDHKVDTRSLKLYRLYHSRPFSMFRTFVIVLLHLLAFFEFPSSLTWTSDIRTRGERVNLPCGLTEAIEFFCFMFFICDIVLKERVYGYHHLVKNRWIIAEMAVISVSLVDWSVSISLGCKDVVRVRRLLRPLFIIQNSSLMKKILNSLRKTVPQIFGVLLLMALHLYIFTLFGMLLFPKPNTSPGRNGMGVLPPSNMSNASTSTGDNEAAYFRTLADSFINLLVLLTTANNPDVTLPAYSRNRLYAIFFIVFLIIGLYCFMNMLTAIIYNQFRGYFLSAMQNSLMRRRLGQRAAFEALKHKSMNMMHVQDAGPSMDEEHSHTVSVRDLKAIISRSNIGQEMKIILIDTIAQGFVQDQMLSWNNFLSVLRMMEMDKSQKEKPSIRWIVGRPWLLWLQKAVCHRYFSYFGNFMALVNVILISFELATEYDKSLMSSKSALRIMNFLFILYYMVEQGLILACMGFRRYRYSWANIYDGSIVLLLLISEIITVALYGFPFFSYSRSEVENNITLWNIVRFINILIMFRVLRIIWHIKAMAIVAHTLLDLVKNLQSFGGILIVIYYFFAMLGMELFQNKITYNPGNGSVHAGIGNGSYIKPANMTCGTYEQLDYWANNFDDFAASLVVLWDVMVVNNWMVFLYAYGKYTSKWSYLYFIAWWLTSVILILNLFTALILENFIMKWDRFYDSQQRSRAVQPSMGDGGGQRRSRALSQSMKMDTLTVHDIFRSNLKEPEEREILENLSQLRFFHYVDVRRHTESFVT
ncbi:two pore channel protein 2-like isoform X1 [Mya arenaria]|uniref:two pore channel protein 2-like isoform X1 n=1 Tax=Mya arenaria TaxID=6604 RepID=UPI0022E2C2C7|nr:two pore channel protein 2-like isoform X1 [Mya arenaria]